MITNIELAQSGVDKFNRFFSLKAKDGVSMQAVMFEVLDVLQDRACISESLIYELGGQYTLSGNPEILTMDIEDVLVTEDDDE